MDIFISFYSGFVNQVGEHAAAALSARNDHAGFIEAAPEGDGLAVPVAPFVGNQVVAQDGPAVVTQDPPVKVGVGVG